MMDYRAESSESSGHPYRRDNIERVRRDEEEARQKEAREEGRMMLADSEARIDLLRERVGPSKDKKKDTIRDASDDRSAPATGKHINLFEDLERNAVAIATHVSKKAEAVEADKGVALAPSAKDLRPWYSEKARIVDQQDAIEDDRAKRDIARKSMNDPLTAINYQLASRESTSSSYRDNQRTMPRKQISTRGSSEVDARLSRESSERQRALELIRRKKRELDGGETPSSMHGARGGYGDVYNRKEVEDAHRIRGRRRESWDRNTRTDYKYDYRK